MSMEADVTFEGKKRFTIKMCEQEVHTDLPEEKGGDNMVPTPSELFIASLGACIGVYAASYLKTAKLDPEGLSINMNWEYDDAKKRIAKISADIKTPNAVLGARKKALVDAANKCSIHNTLREHPDICINVKGE